MIEIEKGWDLYTKTRVKNAVSTGEKVGDDCCVGHKC